MGAIINELARIAHTSNTAIVLVHHTGKSASEDVFNTLRGASALRGGYDVGLLLERKPGEAEAVLHTESRDVEVENMTLRQLANGGWEYVGNSHEIEKIRAGRETIKAMLEHDPDGEGKTAKEIAKHRSVSESAVYRQLNRLVEDGYIEKIDRPSTGEGKEADLFLVKEMYR
jgi:RecA-family ATPase